MVNEDLLKYLEAFVTDERKEKFNDVLAERTRHFTVVLENVFQPHNSSAVIRSCDVFGVQDVYTIEDDYLRKVSRKIARGSQKWLNFNRFKSENNNTEECYKALKKEGYQIIATTPHNESCYLSDFDISKKSAFVFGLEKEGVSDFMMENADGYLKIPMVGFTESLNISVAAAIILQDVTTRLRSSDINWKLTDEEKRVIYNSWIQTTIKNLDKHKANFFNNQK
ncbi:TrmH family RNA methyltransferase [Tenacibaculum sp. M341]|uniref:TrmH family RNA methyltransferase n=1 Tax=Tenacibaculum sp. M341 TaxID=2530339 RepID=UPI00104CBF70|nr:RNA methyltransferase [Tenacibaculum sp. M341]TCI90645.1 TrmH family RNA methyltransferase [Tenacibaculum sp. M341]